MPRIQANRDAIDDRFSVLGFTVRSESPLFEIGVATDPALFHADQKAARSRRNFFSSRSAGVLRARRGEAVYLLPPDVMANFVGQPRLYFGLATYRENSKGSPDSVQAPSSGNMYVNLSGLTERGLRRLVTSARVSSYGQVNGRDASLEWGGDAWPQTQASTAPNGNGKSATPGTPQVSAPAPYDDGFGHFPDAGADTGPRVRLISGDEPGPATQGANGATAKNGTNATSGTNGATAMPASPATPATAQALGHASRNPPPRHPYGTTRDADDIGYSERHGGERGYVDSFAPRGAAAQSLAARHLLSQAQEIISPFYDPSDPASALTCQNNAFSQAMEEWFVGVGNTRMFPHSAICKLTMTGPDGSRYGGTGFYIGRNRILTCAHNLHGMSSVVVMPGSNAADDAPYGKCTVQSSGWRIASRYAGDGDWPNDLAVIDNVAIAAPQGRWFSFLNATPSTRMPIVVCGYSAQSNAVPALTQAIDGERQHLHGGYAAEQSGFDVIEYALLTLKGASGSPVYHLAEDRNGQLEALVTAVHVTGEPAAQGLNRGCFITPQKIDWVEARTKSFALGVPARSLGAISIHWDDVPSYPQTSPASCWAASAAMVVGWRDRVSIPDSEIARWVPAIDAYRTGLWPSDRRQLADAWNLVAEPPASYTLEAWAQMLEAYGPLYIDMTWSGTSGGHVRVLVGMESDGNPDGSGTTMFMHDPWPDTPGRIKLPFADFLELYENRTGNSGGQLLYQILHADHLPAGVQPVTAAPFALTLASEAEPAEAADPAAPAETGEGDPAGQPEPGETSSDFEASMSSRHGAAGSLPAPPAPIVQQQALRARSLAAEIVEVESPIAGTTLKRLRDNDGGVVSWELDQLDGLKPGHADTPALATSEAATPRDGETLLLSEWPYLEAEDGSRISLDLEVRWQHDGSGVGNIRMRRHAASAGQGLRLAVTARVADVAGRFPTDNPVCAALDINVEYRFTRADASSVVAVYALRLFGNGRHNCAGRWLEA